MSSMEILANGEIAINYSDRDYMKTKSEEIKEQIGINFDKNRKHIEDFFQRSKAQKDSFMNELFKMILLQQLTLFDDLVDLSKMMGEAAFKSMLNRQAKNLKVEAETLEQLFDNFVEYKDLIEEMKEAGMEIPVEEFNERNLELITFLSGADLKLEEAGIDTGIREELKVKFGEIETNVAEIFNAKKENTTFMSILGFAAKMAFDGGLTPSDQVLDIMTELAEKKTKNKSNNSNSNEEENSNGMDIMAGVQSEIKEKNKKESSEKPTKTMSQGQKPKNRQMMR